MKPMQKAALSLSAVWIAICSLGYAGAAEDVASSPELPQSQQRDAQVFVGTWRDDQDRFWFTIEEIVGNKVQAAQFWLARLKHGTIEGDSLTLISESCVPLIGCYEYTHIAKMIGPGSMDMYGHSGRCVFSHGCREEGDVVNHILMRD